MFGVGDKNESPYNLMVTGADSSDMRRLTLRENMPGQLVHTLYNTQCYCFRHADRHGVTVSDTVIGTV